MSSEELSAFRSVFTESPLAMWIYDVHTLRFLAVNRTASEVYGYTNDEFLQMDLIQLRPTEDVEEFERQMRIPPDQRTRKTSARHKTKGGEVVNVSISSSPLKFQGHDARVVTVHHVDSKSEIERDRLFDGSPDIMVIRDPAGNMVRVNASFERILGWTPEEALSGKAGRLVHPDDLAQDREVWESLRTGGGSRKWENRIRTRLGPYKFLEWSATADLGIGRIYFIGRDISERKAMDALLSESEKTLRRALQTTQDILDGSVDLISTVDRSGRFVTVSAAVKDLFGCAPKEVVGRCLTEFVAPESAPAVEAELGRIATDGGVHMFESNLARSDGTTVEVMWSARWSDDLEVMFVVGRDVTRVNESRRLLDERITQLMALRTIDIAIAGAMDLPHVMDVVLQQVEKIPGVAWSTILFHDPEVNSLEEITTVAVKRPRSEYPDIAMQLGRRVVRDRRRVILTGPDGAEAGNATWEAWPLVAKGETCGVLIVRFENGVKPSGEAVRFVEALAGQAAIGVDNAMLFDGLQRSRNDLSIAYDETLEGWSRALDIRDKETEGHSRRVTELTMRLARAMNIAPTHLLQIRRGALLHDIGKLGVPDRILLKEGPLTDEEWELMRKHPVYAFEILSPIEFLREALDIPYCHHEKWDGTGYPRGLRHAQIPLAARIFAVVDVWDALTSDRPYRAAWSHEAARQHIAALAGTHFDPKVVQAFLQIVDDEKARRIELM